MALNAYNSALQTLLHDQAGLAYTQATLTGFTNEARQQVALESQSIRGLGSISTVPGQTAYQNSSVTVPATPAGINSLIVPISLQYPSTLSTPNNSTPLVTLNKRGWNWFNFYELGFAQQPPGLPRVWAPFGMGTGTLPQGGTSAGPLTSGSFYINPPNAVYALIVDGIWGPQNLALDTDPEAIPGPWTDAVPLYGLYLAFLDARLAALSEKALETYEVFMSRSQAIVTPLADQQAYPGGLAARRTPGMAPPQRGAAAGPAQGGGGAANG